MKKEKESSGKKIAKKKKDSFSIATAAGATKKYLKNRGTCTVTFSLPKEAVRDAKQVIVAGDFNNWDREATPLEKQKNGGFSVTLELECGREYRYRFLIDGQRWENDWKADRYAPNPFGEEDSVIAV